MGDFNFPKVGDSLYKALTKHGIKALFRDLTKTKFTYQLSDHFPLWLQIDCDIDGVHLDSVINRSKR